MRITVVLCAIFAVAPASAEAGKFHVYGLGLNSAGCPNGWLAHTFSSHFRQRDLCSRWEVESTKTGKIPYRAGALASMFSGEGARFTGFSIRSSGDTRNGVIWKMGMCKRPYADCHGHFPQTGIWYNQKLSLGSLTFAGTGSYEHLWAGVECAPEDGSSCADGTPRAARITHTESHAVVEDFTPPGAPSLSGVSTGWNSGQRQLGYSASDAGSGIESATLTIDGTLHRMISHSCTRLPSGGYSSPVPCSLAASGTFALNEPGQLADGRHSLVVTTRDAGGEAGSTSQEFLVDNNAPGHPLNLAVVGGDGWRGTNDFGVTWENPDQGAGSPVAAAYYRVGPAPTTPTDGTRVSGVGLTELDGLQVPGDGTWGLHVWLLDQAGNASAARSVVRELRLDATPPSLAFSSDRNEHNPAELRVPAHDVTSGVAGGQIDIRRQGIADWRPLDTRLEGTELVANVPDDQLERGTYELRATARDLVGNSATTTLRSDGKEMVVDLPLRTDTRVSAGLVRRPGGAKRTLPAIRVGYRKTPWLRGVLRSGNGTPLPDTRIAVHSRPLAGGDWQALGELVTGGSGRYALKLAAGGSRELRVHFPGTRLLRPASDVAKLLVRGWAKLELEPKRLRRGRSITFAGRVGRLGARLPPAGKLIQIQYRDGHRWRPAVKLGRTNRKGRFAIRYRFRRISRPTKIYFRILVPAEADWPYATGSSKTRIARVRP